MTRWTAGERSTMNPKTIRSRSWKRSRRRLLLLISTALLGPGAAAVEALVDCSELQAELIGRKLQQLTSVHDVVVTYAVTRDEVATGSPSRDAVLG